MTDSVSAALGGLKSSLFQLADRFDTQADVLADKLRNVISRRSGPPPPPPPPPQTVSTISFIDRYRVPLSLVLFSTILTAGYLKRTPVKRRATRAPNGARRDVVLLSGSVHDPALRSIATDLERRGFIVFVLVTNLDDEQTMFSLGGRDIRPLTIDLLDPAAAAAATERFETYLRLPVVAFQGAAAHHLRFVGMVVIPDGQYPSGPVEAVAPDDWSDVLNLRLLAPFLTIRLFIPLLRVHGARLVVGMPTVTADLAPAYHAAESAAVAAMKAFVKTLRRELRPLGVQVSMLLLGTFEVPKAKNGYRADLVSWTDKIKGAYARSYAAQSEQREVRGTPLRTLHHAVFDLLCTYSGTKGKTWRIGAGSWVYRIIGSVAPERLLLPPKGGSGVAIGGGRSPADSSSGDSLDWEKLDRS